MVHHQECPLCRSRNICLNFSCTDNFISKEVFQIYECKECGFGFTQDYPDKGEIGNYYESEDYISHSDTSKGLSNKLYRIVRNIMLIRKREIIKKVTGLVKGNILDIGSGTGYFALIMKKAGWKVKAIEINDKARSFSETQFGIDVSGPDKIHDLDAGSFDCVTLWHVLEHFHDPFRYAAEIIRILKPEGICVVALPNSRSYDAEYYGPFWAAYDVPRHLWHFNPESFRTFSEKTGFELETMKILPMDVFYISLLSEKYKGSSLAFFKGMVKAIAFSLLSAFNKKKSSSLIYILHK